MNSENKNELETNDIIPNMENGLGNKISNDTTKKWAKNCPKCGCEQIYKTEFNFNISIKKNTMCNTCSVKGRKYGKETKLKVSKSLIGNKRNCGKQFNEGWRHKMSISRIGKIQSEETKKKIRVSILKRMERLGYNTHIDEGAPEWFDEYNTQNNTNYKPRRFVEIGYDADGYDEKLHSWIEFDTLHHKKPSKQQRDLLRQNRIIQYFESIKKPLKSFIRIINWENNREKIVYQT